MDTRTAAQDHGLDAQRSVTTMARQLRELADRLESAAERLNLGDGDASFVAGEIVDTYTQSVGSNGTRLWSVVTRAAAADRAFDRARGSSPTREN